MRKVTWFRTATIVLLAAVSFGRTLSATATANFQGDSLQFSHTVDFDATRPFSSPSSCSSGTATYAWDFGDGSTTTGNPVSHVFGNAGAYSVKLTVTCSGGGGTASLTRNVCFSFCVSTDIKPSQGYN